jgi:TolB-like protein/class 3 adenylate cyclase/Tfp pilus assembly protein PilF
LAREQRRLAAIVAADVVGYSRLMGRDESGTLAALKALRREVVDPPIAAHGGRIVKTTGDGLLLEFPSVVDAVRCVVEVQTAMAARGGDIAFRIGVNLGDIIIDGDDIHGDGVNVAARLEAEASAGGIVLAGAVHDAVSGRVKATFEDLGELSLKNIERPVRAYRVRVEGAAAPAPVAVPPPADVPLTLPDKPSIAVLPFQNMSGDPEQEYFADGMVEDIITALSRNKQLFVIARNSSFTYKSKVPDIRQVGRELGVRYVLEGSVRKSGNRVRITGQLIDASNGGHIWADRFDGALDDIFELQDQVASSVIGGISTPLLDAETERARRKVDNLQAYDYLLRSWAAGRRNTEEGNSEALALARKAIALDPDFALGHAALAVFYNSRSSFGWVVDQDGEAQEAERAARRALILDSNDPRVLAWCGQTLVMMLGRLQEGSALLEQAVSLDPNFALGFINRGSARIALGEPEKAIADVERALRLSPIDPGRSYALTLLARAHIYCGRYDKAIPLVADALRMRPNFPASLIDSTVAHALAGDLESARRSLAAYEKIQPGRRIATFRQRAPQHSAAGLEIYIKGLRLAGVPE